MRPLITLTTDFGLNDPFVGIMKGVILGIAPNAEIIDLTHQIEPQNILQASWVIKSAFSYFPPKTTHLVVVDPGVGTSRRALGVESNGFHFVGPDNGVLTPILDDSSRTYELNQSRFFLKTISTTFHGRDIFAPVTAWIGNGTRLSKMGKRIKNPVKILIEEPYFEEGALNGKIVYIDRFGNLISNISSQAFKDAFSRQELMKGIKKSKNVIIQIGRKKINGLSKNYSECDKNNLGIILNSGGLLEVFCHEGNAAKKLNKKIGDQIKISFH